MKTEKIKASDLRVGDQFYGSSFEQISPYPLYTARGPITYTPDKVYIVIQWCEDNGHTTMFTWSTTLDKTVFRLVPCEPDWKKLYLKASQDVGKWKYRYEQLVDVFAKGVTEADLDTTTKVPQKVRDNIRNRQKRHG